MAIIEKERHPEENQKKQTQLARFADKVKRWNKNGKAVVFFTLIAMSGCLFFACEIGIALLVTDGSITFALMEGLTIFLVVVLGFGYAYAYCSCYTTIEGKQGKMWQQLCESIYRMPFSMEKYYKEIGRRLKKNATGIGIAVFCLLFICALFGLMLLEPEEGIKVPLQQIAASGQILQILVFCIIGTAVFTGALLAGYYTHRWMNLQKYHGFLNGRAYRGKKKQKTKNSFREFWAEHKVLLCIVAVMSTMLVMGILALRSYYLRVPEGIEVYRVTRNSFWVSYPLLVCFMILIEEIFRFLLKEKMHIGKAVGVFMLTIAALVYSFTFYETYYEDRIEVRRLFYTAEYKWQDIQSYTVKAAPSAMAIQIKLDMGNRTLYAMSADEIASIEHYTSYYNDYIYGAYLVKKMDELGISGILEDGEKIEEQVQEWDQEEIDAVKEIKQIVTGN